VLLIDSVAVSSINIISDDKFQTKKNLNIAVKVSFLPFGMYGADCRLPTADCRLPTADCRLPTADCRSRTAGVELPESNCRSRTAGVELPESNCRSRTGDLLITSQLPDVKFVLNILVCSGVDVENNNN
jgi:hypothetical protein